MVRFLRLFSARSWTLVILAGPFQISVICHSIKPDCSSKMISRYLTLLNNIRYLHAVPMSYNTYSSPHLWNYGVLQNTCSSFSERQHQLLNRLSLSNGIMRKLCVCLWTSKQHWRFSLDDKVLPLLVYGSIFMSNNLPEQCTSSSICKGQVPSASKYLLKLLE